MGQYHYICNIDKKQYLNPHAFGDGLKLMEFGLSGSGTMSALAVLLAEQNRGGARGGGDLHPWIAGNGSYGDERELEATGQEDRLMDEVVGSWAGDRIAVFGDYSDGTDPVASEHGTPWTDEGWADISDDARAAVRLDYYARGQMRGA